MQKATIEFENSRSLWKSTKTKTSKLKNRKIQLSSSALNWQHPRFHASTASASAQPRNPKSTKPGSLAILNAEMLLPWNRHSCVLIAHSCRLRSAFYWFAEFCHSRRLSHFAASFIVTCAEASTDKSCKKITNINQSLKFEMGLATGGRERPSHTKQKRDARHRLCLFRIVEMILPQVHLRKPCYDFSFL